MSEIDNWFNDNTGGYNVGDTFGGGVDYSGGDSSGYYGAGGTDFGSSGGGGGQPFAGFAPMSWESGYKTANSGGGTSGGGGGSSRNTQPSYSNQTGNSFGTQNSNSTGTQNSSSTGTNTSNSTGTNTSSSTGTQQGSQTGTQQGTNTSINTSTTTRTPTMAMPTLGTQAPYTNPMWSKEQIKAYAQEDAALGISEARDALYQGINKVVSMQGNPTAQASAMRDLLKGHGSAIAKTMQGANKDALNRYQTQYAYQVQEAVQRFNAIQNDAYSKFNASMQAYMGTMAQNTVGTSSGTYGGTTGSNTQGTSTQNTQGTSTQNTSGTSTNNTSGTSTQNTSGTSTNSTNQGSISGYGDPQKINKGTFY